MNIIITSSYVRLMFSGIFVWMVFTGTGMAQELDPLERAWPASESGRTDWPLPVMDNQTFVFMQADRLEAGFNDGEKAYTWDVQGWAGKDYHKLWFKSEGEGLFNGSLESMEVQALYSRLLSPFWDLQLGARYDIRPQPDRGHAVIGIQGLAPYWLEVDAATFISNEGDVSFRAELEYELLLTQRLILQPRFELNASAQDIPELGIGNGINNTEIGLRLRYEIRRELAPYIGISWDQRYGETADYLRAEGEGTSDVSFILGVRFWY